jgi:anaerobic magnesium-protoporphyrin IX monomethyl ester cyclase
MKRYLFVEAQKLWQVLVEGFNITIPLDIVQPMGLVQLAAMIRERDPDAELKIIDLRLYNNDYSTLDAELKEYDPEFVGFRIVSRDSLFANDMIKQFRDMLPKAVMVGGGPHVTAWMGKVLEETPLDFAVFGEGEMTLLDLLEHIDAGGGYDEVDGLIYRDKEGPVRTNRPREYIQNLDVLPLPAWDLLDHEKYFDSMYFPQVPIYLNAEREVCSIFTSRACPYGCTFCHSIFGKKFRAQSPEKTIAEIEYLYHVFGIRQFDIRDDIFNFDKNRVNRICDLIRQKKLKLKLTFPNGLRGDIMDRELVLKLKEAGMYRTTYALETASPRIQKMIKKNINLERLREIIRFTSEQDILVLVFVMLGFPTETREELLETVEYTLDPALDFALIHSVNPFEGTEMAGTLKEEGIDIEEFRARYDYLSVNFSVCKVSAEELQEIKSNLIRSFFTEKRFENMVRKLMLYAFKC